QLAQAVDGSVRAESFRGLLMKITGAKATATCEMDETGERLHDGQQACIVQLQARGSVAAWGDCRLAQPRQLATVDVGFEHVLLDGEVAIVDAMHHAAELG